MIQALNRRDGDFGDEDEELLRRWPARPPAPSRTPCSTRRSSGSSRGSCRPRSSPSRPRDPTTAGHSGRVATLTVGLARAVEQAPPPAWRGVRFDAAALQQLRYAALLHDFGKVGVREHVLVKADKLYPHELELLEARFELARAALENERLRARLAGPRRGRGGGAARRARRPAWRWCWWPTARRCWPRRPRRGWRSWRGRTFADPRGADRGRSSPARSCGCSPSRAARSPSEERLEIESHVTHTFRFLSQIPWTRALRRVPEIAYGHHEKLDGSGYPRAVPAPGHRRGDADDDHRRHLRRPHRQRPPLQEGAARRSGPSTSSPTRRSAGRWTARCFGVFVEARPVARARHRRREARRGWTAPSSPAPAPLVARAAAGAACWSTSTAGVRRAARSSRPRPTTARSTGPRTPSAGRRRAPASCSAAPRWPTSTSSTASHGCMNVITGAPGRALGGAAARRASRSRAASTRPRGPGNLCRALAIDRERAQRARPRRRHALLRARRRRRPARIVATPRVNVDSAGPRWAGRRWRFVLAPSDWISGPDRAPLLVPVASSRR